MYLKRERVRQSGSIRLLFYQRVIGRVGFMMEVFPADSVLRRMFTTSLWGVVLMNRKGSFTLGKEVPFWIIFTFILPVLFLLGGFAASTYKNTMVSVPAELSSELVSLRFTQSPDCFAYTDAEREVVMAGVIDLSTFNAERMVRCYNSEMGGGSKTFNFRLKLVGMDREVITRNYYYHNKDKLTLFKDVIVYDGKTFSKDQLVIYVQERIAP